MNFGEKRREIERKKKVEFKLESLEFKNCNEIVFFFGFLQFSKSFNYFFKGQSDGTQEKQFVDYLNVSLTTSCPKFVYSFFFVT
jgi:hypothetical protein